MSGYTSHVRYAYQKIRVGDTVSFKAVGETKQAVVLEKLPHGALSVDLPSRAHSATGEPLKSILYADDVLTITRNGQGVF